MSELIFVGVSYSFKATHNWPEASQLAGQQVAFLESRHRHTFFLDVEMQVHHDDRDVEFFVLQGQVRDIVHNLYGASWDGLVYNLGRKSCETIGLEILGELRKLHPHAGDISMRVSEDNEVWARIQSKSKS